MKGMKDKDIERLVKHGFRYLIAPCATQYSCGQAEGRWHSGWHVIAVWKQEETYREEFEDLESALKHGLSHTTRTKVSPIEGSAIPPRMLELAIPASRALEVGPMVAAINASTLRLIPFMERDAEEIPHSHDVCERVMEQAAEWGFGEAAPA